MLVWTASGEPAIPESKINSIKRYFENCELIDRVGFDCKVRFIQYIHDRCTKNCMSWQITPNLWHGMWCDFLVSLSSVYFHVEKIRYLLPFLKLGDCKNKKV